MTSAAVGSELNELFQPTQGEPRTYVPPSSPPGRDLAAIDPSMNAMAFGNAKLRDRTDGPRLIVTGGSGDQAIAFKVDGKDRDLRLEPTNEVFPLRRYGGRALVA